MSLNLKLLAVSVILTLNYLYGYDSHILRGADINYNSSIKCKGINDVINIESIEGVVT